MEDLSDDFVYTFRDLQNQKMETLVGLWYAFAGTYSMNKFTFASDRLPALSGIAARVQDCFPQKYIAGLWESNIIQGLAWGVPGTPSQKSPSLSAIAMGIQQDATRSDINMPSWSWASSDRLIHFFFGANDWTSMIRVKSWLVNTQGAATSGQVLNGTLRLEGAFQMMNLVNLSPPFSRAQFDYYGFVYEKDIVKYFSDRHFPCILLGTESRVHWRTRTVILLAGALILQPTGRCVDPIEEYRRVGFLKAPFKEHWSEITETRVIDLV